MLWMAVAMPVAVWMLCGQAVAQDPPTGEQPTTRPAPEKVLATVGKAEITPEGENPRFVVHNLRERTPRKAYQFFAQRGEMENRIKELKLALKVDRTSCHHFLPNAFRVILHVASYVLWVALRERLAGTELARAQVFTLRERLVKVAAFSVWSLKNCWARCWASSCMDIWLTVIF